MKRLLIPACFAAVAASAVELRNPAEVSREWNRTVEEAQQSVVSSTLAGQTSFTPKFSESPPVFFGPDHPAARPPIQPGPRYDAPGYQRHRKLPHDRPAGAMPWEYKGQTYWLVPLAPTGAP